MDQNTANPGLGGSSTKKTHKDQIESLKVPSNYQDEIPFVNPAPIDEAEAKHPIYQNMQNFM